MTMLNGEPIETPSISTASTAPPTVTPQPASQGSQSVGFIMGLMSLIFAFSIPIAGAIIGGIAMKQAKEGGYPNTLAKAGFILGIVFSVLIILFVVGTVLFSVGLFTTAIDACTQPGTGESEYNGIPIECG